jgi:hypothetical protein
MIVYYVCSGEPVFFKDEVATHVHTFNEYGFINDTIKHPEACFFQQYFTLRVEVCSPGEKLTLGAKLSSR